MRVAFKGFAPNTRGSVTLIAALALPVLLGMGSLVAEYGVGLLTKAEHQRTADLASYAGALAYTATSSTTSTEAAADRIALLNDLTAASLTSNVGTSPRGNGNKAVSVLVRTSNRMFLAPVLGIDATLPVAASAMAEVGGKTEGCILALSGSQSGVSLTGGTRITATKCGVASNASFSVPCGTFITTPSITYNTSAPSVGCGGIQPPSGGKLTTTKKSTSDPLASNSAISTARARISTVAALTSPAAPSVTALTAVAVSAGTDIDVPYWNDPNFAPRIRNFGCTAVWSEGWTITCPSGGNYKFGNLTGMGAKWAISGSASGTKFSFSSAISLGQSMSFGDDAHSAIYSFAGDVSTGATVTFGPGTFNFNGKLTTGGTTTFGDGTINVVGALVTGGTTTFGDGAFNFNAGATLNGTTELGTGTLKVRGALAANERTTFKTTAHTISGGLTTGGGATASFVAGTYTIGPNSSNCGGSTYSICNNGGSTLTIPSGSTFVLSAGVYNGGNLLSLGSGSGNSFKIGVSGAGPGVNAANGDTILGAASTFQVKGNVVSGGGTCFTIGAATQHDIAGNISLAGGASLGAGIYTVDGYFALGENNGGSVNCSGYNGVVGTGVTFVVSGKATACSGQAFCVSAGYSNVSLTAPTSGTTAKLVVIGPAASSNSAGALFAAGASGTSISGVLYFPNGPIALSGGASLGDDSGQCLQIVGSRITLDGGTATGSTCISSSGGAATSTAVILVR